MGYTILGIWLLLTFMALYANYKENNTWMISVDINRLNSPFFELGLSNRHWHNDEGRCIETYTLGLFLLNVQLDFFTLTEEELNEDE